MLLDLDYVVENADLLALAERDTRLKRVGKEEITVRNPKTGKKLQVFTKS